MGLPDDTIFALATARGKSGIAIVRLSGPNSVDVLASFGASVPPVRSARIARLRDRDGALLDEALVLRFDEGGSFTGETVVELHLHGSVAIIRAVLQAIEATGMVRPAEAGEFTRRALMNGRLDLTQVQGLRDMIDAETEVQRRHALRVFSGEMADRIGEWRRAIMRAVALVEATIDFVDEDVPVDVMPEVCSLIEYVAVALEREVSGGRSAARIRSGFEVALVGPPNVGKSSLINALSRSEVAIVSDQAGTTRDVIEVRLDLDGIPVTILDMAGLRDSSDAIELIGVARARQRAADADIRVFLHEGDDAIDSSVAQVKGDIVLRTKIDVYGGSGISVLTGEGVAELLATLIERLGGRVADAGLIASDRDMRLFEAALSTLRQVLSTADTFPPEVLSEELRRVAMALQSAIGGIGTEEILGEIFSSFCIGK